VNQQGEDQASCTTTYGSSQQDAVTAAYGGDSNFNGSTSPVLTVSVNPTTTSTALTVDNASPVVGQKVTFTATVTASGAGASNPTGSVTFADSSGTLCTSSLSGSDTATCATSYPAIGSDSVTATYSGDSNDLSSSSSPVTVSTGQAATSTSLSTTDASPVVGEPVTYTATVAATAPGSGTPTGDVTFKGSNGAVICAHVSLSLESPDQASCTTQYAAPGSDSVTATYNGDPNYSGSVSGAQAEVISQAQTTTSLSDSISKSVTGQDITFTAGVSVVSPGTGTPSGSVVFTSKIGSATTTLCTSTLSDSTPDQATCTVSYGGDGSHTVTASYQGATGYSASASSPVTVSVAKAATTTKIVVSPAAPVTGQAVTVSATVAAVAPSTGTPGGHAVFSVSTASGTAVDCSGGNIKSLSSGQASCTLPASQIKSHESPLYILVGYEGTTGGYQPSQASTHLAVKAGSTTVTVSSSRSPSAPGAAVTFTAKVAAASPSTGTPGGDVTFSFAPGGPVCTGGDTVALTSAGKAVCHVASGMISAPVQVTGAYGGSTDYKPASGSFSQQVS
jgi:hypothetical protein